jgi:hypothetical protein
LSYKNEYTWCGWCQPALCPTKVGRHGGRPSGAAPIGGCARWAAVASCAPCDRATHHRRAPVFLPSPPWHREVFFE